MCFLTTFVQNSTVMETIPERPIVSNGPQNNVNSASSNHRRSETSNDLRSKEQRRRERRERRAARRQQQQQSYGHYRDPFTIYGSVYGSSAIAANMPDILNSHMPPPPYSTLPHAASRPGRSNSSAANGVQPSAAVRSATARARRWRPLPAFTGTTTDLQRWDKKKLNI